MKNTTIQNRSKQQRLASKRALPSHHVDTPQVTEFLQHLDALTAPKELLLYSIGTVLVTGNSNPALQAFLNEYQYEPVDVPSVPVDAFDLLGSAYQYLNSKMENLAKGSFYTGKKIVLDFVGDLDFSDGQTLLDPSCGSGAFLFRASAPADQIVGVDIDPIAVMIAKFNYFLKFPDADPPALYCEDFFAWLSRNPGLKFDYVVGNPPYGAELDLTAVHSRHISSGESFSYFIESGFQLLKPEGRLRYLVPDALLNVKRHTDVRRFLLNHTNLKAIKRYPGKFTGLMSSVYKIELDRELGQTHTTFGGTSAARVPKALFRSLKNCVLVDWTEEDVAVVRKVDSLRKFDLGRSVFALGVVTGDNKSKLLPEPRPGSEPIYTGREVTRYALLPARYNIVYDRGQLQQVAPDHIYRAPEKLVYKTISKHLRFALDSTGTLTTNSANLLIPRLPGYGATAVMAFLNSRLYSFLYLKLFGGVNKIGKEHLMALPFPEITSGQNSQVAGLVKHAMESGSDAELQTYIHARIFGLSNDDEAYIGQVLGRAVGS